MRFRFFRVGGRGSVDETCSKLDLYECFGPCTQAVKDELDAFIESKEESVMFEFDDEAVVIVERETK